MLKVHSIWKVWLLTGWVTFPSSLSFDHYVKAKKNINSNLNTWRKNPPKDWAKDDQPIALSILDQQNMGSMVKTFTVIKSSVSRYFYFFNDSCSLERRCPKRDSSLWRNGIKTRIRRISFGG